MSKLQFTVVPLSRNYFQDKLFTHMPLSLSSMNRYRATGVFNVTKQYEQVQATGVFNVTKQYEQVQGYRCVEQVQGYRCVQCH